MSSKSKPPRELVKFLEPYDRPIRELALQLRAVVLAELEPGHENIYDAYNAVAIGYGSSERLRDAICHIAVYARHVNLGFNHGAELDDPEGFLKGSGKAIRHLTIKSIADLARPEIHTYLQRARKQAAATATASPAKEMVSVVKAIYPKKRRPKKKDSGSVGVVNALQKKSGKRRT
jgi:hypothetical protein